MRLFAEVWTTVTTVAHWLIISPLEDYGLWQGSQQPIGGLTHHFPSEIAKPPKKQPLLTPPGSNLPGFECNYGPDWYDCSTDYVGCWIKNRKTGQVYDIYTDYETDTPPGVMRNYVLTVTDEHTINIDGIDFTQAKLFNNIFPGPLLEACWGDTLSITVINSMKWNGTSIHWHGIRQLNTVHMDGVNGLTQCPIAPGSNFTYVWDARQYGSSWYHSHYSVQYADGLQGPITIHGPTSKNYDEAVVPLLTSDWLHNTAFSAILPSGSAGNPTIILNGTGNCERFFTPNVPSNCGPSPPGFEYVFNNGSSSTGSGRTKYLLRIINTSFATSITFSIDNHNFTVVEADFVPTEATYTTSSAVVAIGQRLHIIVEALADPFGEEPNGNFWIRTSAAGCFDDITGNGNGTDWARTGIIRYNPSSQADPQSQAWPNAGADNCLDDLTMKLSPVYKWNVTAPKNGPGGETFIINFKNPKPYALAFVAFQPQQGPQPNSYFPFQTSWDNPTFLNLDNDGDSWPNGWMVIPENYTATDFVYLIIEGGGHPIHLHGHDFAVVEYVSNKNYDPSKGFNAPYSDLMRRDVILTPPGGYAVIAFKTDNPGAWLMHCHIAFHASGGLSLQIMERQSAANTIWPPGNSAALRAARQTCTAWNNWLYDCQNFWPGEQDGIYPACGNVTNVQNDSGV